MRVQQILKWFTVCLMLFAFASTDVFAQKKGKKNKNKKDKSGVIDGSGSKGEGKFILASKEKLLGNMENAKKLFLQCIEMNPDNDAAQFELARIFYDERNTEEAMKYAEAAANLDSGNKWYQFLYAELLAKDGRFDEAAQLYGALIERYPNNPEFYLDQAYMYRLSGDYKEGIRVLDALESKMGIDEEISFEKQRMYIKMDKVEEAANEIKKLTQAFPKETRYYRLLADIYSANGMEDKAMGIYQELLEKNPDDPYARLALASHYRENGDREKGIEELKKAFSNPELELEPKMQILLGQSGALNGADPEQMKETTELAKVLSEVHPNAPKTHAFYGDLLMQSGEKEKAVVEYQKALKLDQSWFEVWQQMFFVQAELQQFDDLADDSKQAMELFPNQPMLYYFNGLANNRLGESDKAIKSLKQAIMIGSDNKTLMSEMCSQLGDIYNGQKDYEHSDEYFDKALEYDGNNALVLNNYGYFLSLRDENLEKAAEMSKKSNDLEPNNASYLDTYGWILYQMNRMDEAKEWLEKSMANGGDERSVILDHYGDVLYRLKQIDQAVEFWKKAKEKGLNSEVLNRKIADRKIYE